MNAVLPVRSGRNRPLPDASWRLKRAESLLPDQEVAAIVSDPAAEGNPADTVKKGQPTAAERERAAEASEKPAAESGAAVPGETPTGEKTPDNGDPAPAALSPQADEPQTDA